MRNTILILVLSIGSITFAESSATTKPAPISQIERIMEAMTANYNANQAFRNQNWSAAVEYSDKEARLLQDCMVEEANRNAAVSSSVASR